MEKTTSEDTKILFLEIEGLNKDFYCGKHANQIIINTEENSSQVVFNNNDCFVYLNEVKDGFHISAECLYSNKNSQNLVDLIEDSLQQKWQDMFNYFDKNHSFQDSDCKFYNYVNGDFSRLSINRVGRKAVISYRLFVDNSGFTYDKAIKLGIYIIEVLQTAIISIKDRDLTDFLNILILNLFNKISFLDTYYEILFKELSETNNYKFSELYYYHNKLTTLCHDISFDDVKFESDIGIDQTQNNNLPF